MRRKSKSSGVFLCRCSITYLVQTTLIKSIEIRKQGHKNLRSIQVSKIERGRDKREKIVRVCNTTVDTRQRNGRNFTENFLSSDPLRNFLFKGNFWVREKKAKCLLTCAIFKSLGLSGILVVSFVSLVNTFKSSAYLEVSDACHGKTYLELGECWTNSKCQRLKRIM